MIEWAGIADSSGYDAAVCKIEYDPFFKDEWSFANNILLPWFFWLEFLEMLDESEGALDLFFLSLVLII